MFLVKLIKKKPEAFININNLEITSDALDSGDINNILVGPLMFQSGYLTVKDISYESAPPVYTLEMPNLEVKDAFNKHVLAALAEKDEVETRTLAVDLRKALRSSDMDKSLAFLGRSNIEMRYEVL